MMRKSLIAALGFMGLVAAGTMAGTAPASAGYYCGPWNNWCRPVCGYWNGWCAGVYASPGFSWGYSNHRYWGGSYGHRNWGNNSRRGHYAHKGGNNNRHAHKRSNGRSYR